MLTTSKRSNSARLPQFLHLTSNTARLPHFWKLATSKTNNSMRLPFNNEKLSAELTASCQRVLRFFQSVSLKASPATKKGGQVIQSAGPVTQNHLSKLEDLMLQNATPLRKSAPWPPNISDEHVSCSRAYHGNCILYLYGSSSNVPRLPTLLARCRIPCTCHVKRRPNVQKCSEALNLSISDFLRATTACTFSTSQLPKAVRDRQFLTLLTSKCASRHNGMHFFVISTLLKVLRSWGVHLTRCLRTRRFSEPTFRPSGATNHWKNTVNRDFSTFSRTCIFFLLTLSLLWSSLFFSSLLWLFPPLLFHLSILLTSKLPSTIEDICGCLMVCGWVAGIRQTATNQRRLNPRMMLINSGTTPIPMDC